MTPRSVVSRTGPGQFHLLGGGWRPGAEAARALGSCALAAAPSNQVQAAPAWDVAPHPMSDDRLQTNGGLNEGRLPFFFLS